MSPPILVNCEKAGLIGAGKPKLPRDFARLCGKEGIAFLAKAFNMCDNQGLPYRYSNAVRDRFTEMASELVELIEDGKIVELPHVLARNDQEFSAFMASALQKSKKPRHGPRNGRGSPP